MGASIALGGFALFVITFVLIALAIVYSSRVKKVGPNEVLVVSGRKHSLQVGPDAEGNPIYETRGYRLVTGGRSFIWPVIERVDYLNLELMTIEVTTEGVYTVQGVPVTVDGVAQVKIGSDPVDISVAAERFLSKSRQEIEYVAHETLAGHLRGILGTLTVEQIYKDRDAFAQEVLAEAAKDLENMGLAINSFVIKDIQDERGYLEALGRPRTAEVKRDATIGEAEAERDATIKSAQARQAGETAKYEAEARIAESEKEYKVQKASYDAEVNRRTAEAELAYPLQQNITNQEVRAEEVQVEVVEKQKRIEVETQEVARREKELEATVRKPAEAEQFRIEKLASAKKFQTETEAEGQSAALRQVGQGEADAIRARGLAEADAIRARGLAEAEAMEKKAHAWQQYTQAAIIQQLIESLPQVANAVAEPLSKTERIVIIGTGDGAGASKLTQDITNIVAQVPEAVEALTGVNLLEVIKNLPAIAGAESAEKEGPKPKK